MKTTNKRKVYITAGVSILLALAFAVLIIIPRGESVSRRDMSAPALSAISVNTMAEADSEFTFHYVNISLTDSTLYIPVSGYSEMSNYYNSILANGFRSLRFTPSGGAYPKQNLTVTEFDYTLSDNITKIQQPIYSGKEYVFAIKLAVTSYKISVEEPKYNYFQDSKIKSFFVEFCLYSGAFISGMPGSFFTTNNEEHHIPTDIQVNAWDDEVGYTTVYKETPVFDNDGNKLLYHAETGLVYSGGGLTYTKDSQPVLFDSKTQSFMVSTNKGMLSTNDTQQSFYDGDRLELIKRSTGGLQNHFLTFGEYNVRSFGGINEELFIVGIKANTEYNFGKAYDMLVTRVYIGTSWWEQVFLKKYGYYEYYDLRCQRIEEKYIKKETSSMNFISTVGINFSGSYAKVEPYGTVKDLLDECLFLIETLIPTDEYSPGDIVAEIPEFGTFALDPATGNFLRDNMGNRIKVSDDGYLTDVLGYPLLGTDARPVFIRLISKSYVNYSGQALSVNNNMLIDKNGVTVYTVLSREPDAERLYFVYISLAAGSKDPATGQTLTTELRGKYWIPATAKNLAAGTGGVNLEYYDLNGNKITATELVAPKEASKEDRNDYWPEEFPNWWDKVTDWFAGFSKTMRIIGIVLGVILLIFIIIIVIKVFEFITIPFRWIGKMLKSKKKKGT